jgi:hypothetical protein
MSLARSEKSAFALIELLLVMHHCKSANNQRRQLLPDDGPLNRLLCAEEMRLNFP